MQLKQRITRLEESVARLRTDALIDQLDSLSAAERSALLSFGDFMLQVLEHCETDEERRAWYDAAMTMLQEKPSEKEEEQERCN